MSYFHELFQNAAATYRLQPRYYWLTSAVGLMAVAGSLLLLLAAGEPLASLFGLQWRGTSRSESISPLQVALFVATIPVLFLASALAVAAIAAVVMVGLGLLSPAEAKLYVLRSRYPARWFKQEGEASHG